VQIFRRNRYVKMAYKSQKQLDYLLKISYIENAI